MGLSALLIPPWTAGMNRYQATIANLKQTPRTWLITGVAGFRGSKFAPLHSTVSTN